MEWSWRELDINPRSPRFKRFRSALLDRLLEMGWNGKMDSLLLPPERYLVCAFLYIEGVPYQEMSDRFGASSRSLQDWNRRAANILGYPNPSEMRKDFSHRMDSPALATLEA